MVTKSKAGSRKAVTVKRKTSGKKKASVEEDLTSQPFNPTEHTFVPKHEKLSVKEAKAILEKYHAGIKEMPKIGVHDPAIVALGAKQGDIIRITRKSYTTGETVFYRGVVDE